MLSGLPDEQLGEPSYPDEWSIAQVASHLGSGAEIFGLFLDAGRRKTPAPGAEEFQLIWLRWNAMPAPEQSKSAIAADAELISQLEALTPDEGSAWQLDLFGNTTNLAGLLRMRLGEHLLHSWDIAVALDPTATVPDAGAAYVLDSLPGLATLAGKAMPNPRAVHVVTPHRSFVLEPADDGVRLQPTSSEPEGTSARLQLPAEAFVRLVYGRMDVDHTPASVEADGVDLADLRVTFPGI